MRVHTSLAYLHAIANNIDKRELFNDQVIISFNFTDGHPPYSINKTQSIVLEKWVKKGLNALPLYRSSNILTTCPSFLTLFEPK